MSAAEPSGNQEISPNTRNHTRTPTVSRHIPSSEHPKLWYIVRWDRSTSSKPFKCQEAGCEKSFTANNSLQNHMRKHTGEQPYACPYDDCDERFTLKTGLQTHLKIHEALMGQRSLCLHSACRKTFKDDAELRAHIYASCPGLVEECRTLRNYLTSLVTILERPEEQRRACIPSAVEQARTLLTALPEQYLQRREDVVDACRSNISNCCASSESRCVSATMLPPATALEAIQLAWNFHKEAAAEVASNAAAAKTTGTLTNIMGDPLPGGGNALLASGISTLIMAATAELDSRQDEVATGTKRKTEHAQEFYTEKFFRTSSSDDSSKSSSSGGNVVLGAGPFLTFLPQSNGPLPDYI